MIKSGSTPKTETIKMAGNDSKRLRRIARRSASTATA
jgi:hypothetical protein